MTGILFAGAVAVVVDRLLASGRVRIPGLSTAEVGPPSARPIRTLDVLDVPIETAWAAVSDVPAQTLWMAEMKAVRVLTPGPIGVGTMGEADVRVLGVGVTDPVEFTAWEPPTRFAIRHLGSFRGRGEIRLRAGADGTTTIVEWEEVLVPPFLPELGAIAARAILGRIFQADLHRFRRLVDAGTLPRRR